MMDHKLSLLVNMKVYHFKVLILLHYLIKLEIYSLQIQDHLVRILHQMEKEVYSLLICNNKVLGH